MNVLNIYSKLYSSIGNYCTNLGKTNDYVVEKHFDIESQKNIDIVIKSIDKLSTDKLSTDKLSTNLCEYVDNNKSYNMTNYLMPEYLILGYGFDRTNGLEWKRISINNDYIVSYKGSHLIPFEQIKKIYNKIEYIDCIDFEKILKLYIDCGKNLDITLTYLEL
jgi:hypothetical protein